MWAAVVTPANPVVVVNTSGDGLWFALLGLFGVLLGALITGGFSCGVARRKERSDAAAERKRRAVEVRRAARLIDDELLVALAAALWSIDNKEWFGQRLTSLAWDQYRDVLASGRELSEDPWRLVMVAGLTIGQLQADRDRQVKRHHSVSSVRPVIRSEDERAAIARDPDYFEPSPISDATLAQLGQLAVDLKAGRTALAPLLSDPPAAPEPQAASGHLGEPAAHP